VREFVERKSCDFDWWHILAKWFLLEHDAHTLPHAGHFSLMNTWSVPQYLHRFNLSVDAVGLCALSVESMSLWEYSLFTVSGLKTFSCVTALSVALQMSMVLFSVRALSRNNNFCVEASRIPKTIRSRSSDSIQLSQYLHDLIRVRNVAREDSNVSLSCWLRLLKT